MRQPRSDYETASGSSDDASSNDASSDDASSVSNEGCGYVDLTVERLQSLHNGETTVSKSDMSEYAKTGCSQDRVENALHKPCCKCRCRVPRVKLMKILFAFWLLNKAAQDSLLWSIQHEAGSNKNQWFIQGIKLGNLMFSNMNTCVCLKFTLILFIACPVHRTCSMPRRMAVFDGHREGPA